MDFITTEVATQLGLTPEQIEGIKTPYNDHIAVLKQTFGQEASANAEGILSGAAAKLEKDTGIKRAQGEKLGDYYVRAGNEFLAAKNTEIDALKTEYQTKLKDFNGGDATKTELEKAKSDLDAAQQKLVDYDDLKAKAEKLETMETEYSSLKERVFFQNDKPNFPDTVNAYEAKAIWEEFVSAFKDKWEITFNEKGESVAKNKENPHLTKKLSDLVGSDEKISALMAGRKQEGTGSKQGHQFAGVDLPENPTSDDISKAINAQLDAKGYSKLDKERPKEFLRIHKEVTASLKEKAAKK